MTKARIKLIKDKQLGMDSYSYCEKECVCVKIRTDISPVL